MIYVISDPVNLIPILQDSVAADVVVESQKVITVTEKKEMQKRSREKQLGQKQQVTLTVFYILQLLISLSV